VADDDRHLIGTVRDEHGRPVPHVTVTARSDRLRVEHVAHTGLDGGFDLALTPGSYQLAVDHEDYCHVWKNVDLRDQSETADFALTRGASISGRVIARSTNQPVPRAAVEAFASGDFASADADDDGLFVLRGLRGGVVFVTARGRGFASTEPTRVGIDAGAQLDDIVVAIDSAFSISGRVVLHTDPAHGIEGATVTTQPQNEMPVSRTSAVSDSNGDFEIHGLLPGVYHVRADKDGLLLESGMRIEIVDQNVGGFSFHMRRGARLTGRVEPAAVAQIGVGLIGPETHLGMVEANLARASTQSGADGTFVIDNVPPGEYELAAMALDGRSGSVALTVVGEEALNGLVIHLSPRMSVAGQVRDQDGNPIAGLYVFPSQLDVPLERRFRRNNIYRGATTAADGTFKVVGLEAGRHQLSVVSPGAGSTGGAKVDVDLTNGHREDVAIVVQTHSAQLCGQVLDAHKQPAGGIFVVARSRGMDTHAFGGHAQTDRHGNFVLRNVPPGRYSLVVLGDFANPRPVAEVNDIETGRPTTIMLPTLGSLRIDVTCNGIAARDVLLRCRCGDFIFDAQGIHGSHTFQHLIAGEYICDALGADGAATSSVSVRGDLAILRLELEDYASVIGRVVNVLTGEPVTGMCVLTFATSGETDASGRFVIERVAPGTGELLVMPKSQLGQGHEKCAYSAKPGESVDVGPIKVVAPRIGGPGTYGFTLEVRDDKLCVQHVKNGGPADLAGIQVGDEIVSIEMRAVIDLGLERARRLLASDNVSIDKTITLGLVTNRSVTLTSVTW